MKKVTFFLFLAISAIQLLGQSVNSDMMFNRIYNRNSITFVMLTHGDEYDSYVVNNFLKEKFSKYNQNEIGFNLINTSISRDVSQDQKSAMILNTLNKEQTAKKIISVWFNRDENGLMDLEKVKERGVYDANEYQSFIANQSVRGVRLLQDAGDNLISKSFIVVFDVSNITKNISKAGILTWNGNVETYVYTINFTDEVKNNFWTNCWVSKSNDEKLTQTEIESKVANFNQNEFKVNPLFYSKNAVIRNTSKDMLNAFATFSLALTENSNNPTYISYNGDGVNEFNEFMGNAYITGMQAIEKKRPDFIVKTAISSVKPVQAKIGVKESLRKKQKYDVYVGKYNEKTDSIESKYVGSIRAAKIVDNTDTINGKSLTSKFATIYQKREFQPFMTIQQKNDKQIGWYYDMCFNDFGGDYTLGMETLNFITPSGFSGALSMDANLLAFSVAELGSFYLRLGYNFGFNLVHPNIKITPFLTGGMGVIAGGGESSLDLSFSWGTKLSYNLSEPFQLYLKLEKESSLYLSSYDVSLPAYIGAGLKYSF